jgi:hypothetical protein
VDAEASVHGVLNIEGIKLNVNGNDLYDFYCEELVVVIGESYFGKESFNSILEWPRFNEKHCWNNNLQDSPGKNYNATYRSLCVTCKAGSG